MRYGSICSGVEAASLAWAPLGWTPAFFAEVEPFPAAVIMRRWGATKPLRPLDPAAAPNDKDRTIRARWTKDIAAFPAGGSIPNLGDFTKIQPEDYDGDIDLLVGGTPCQSFSLAGLRRGLADPRGNLMLEFTRLAYRARPRWLVWENVPGVLTSGDRGSDFAAFLSLLAGWEVKPPAGGWRKSGIVANAPGCYGVAWRVLDAQYTRVPEFPRAVPQRRRRVILVGHLGSWKRAAEVLFDGEMRGGDTPPRREPGQETAGNPPAGAPEDCTLRVRCGKPGGGKGALVSPGVSQCLATGNDQTLFQFYRENAYGDYRDTDAAGPCRAARGAVDGGETLVASRPCWWDGKAVAPTLTTRSLGQRMPDEGQLPCIIDSRDLGSDSRVTAPTLQATDYKGGKLVVPPVCPTLDASYPGKRTLQDCDKLLVTSDAFGASLDVFDGCPALPGASHTLKVSGSGHNTAVALVPKAYSIPPKDSNVMKSANPDTGFPERDVAKTLDTTPPDPNKAQGGLAIVAPLGFIKNDVVGKPAVGEDVYPTLRTKVTPAVAIPIDGINASDRPSNPDRKCGVGEDGDPSPPLTTFHRHAVCIALDGDKIAKAERKGGSGLGVSEKGVMYTETAKDVHAVCTTAFQPCAGTVTTRYGSNFNGKASATSGDVFAEESGIVRRLLPVECERLMGFPDDYTRIPWKDKPAEACPDAPRYKACGNSMCVNVMAWVGRRIQENEEKHA